MNSFKKLHNNIQESYSFYPNAPIVAHATAGFCGHPDIYILKSKETFHTIMILCSGWLHHDVCK
jgi:hypothetical protein